MTQGLAYKLRFKRIIQFEELNERIKYNIDLPEIKRKSLPKVELNEVEYEFLKGLVEGRNQFEIMAGLKFLGINKSYYQIMGALLKKFDALTLSNAIYKAMKMGIID